jgi:vacuolar-type H+-ATPase subunit I/STV1
VNRDRAYHEAIRGFSLVFVVVGLLLLVVTLANGGGPASIGFLMGILFCAVGIGRFWIAGRQDR